MKPCNCSESALTFRKAKMDRRPPSQKKMAEPKPIAAKMPMEKW